MARALDRPCQAMLGRWLLPTLRNLALAFYTHFRGVREQVEERGQAVWHAWRDHHGRLQRDAPGWALSKANLEGPL